MKTRLDRIKTGCEFVAGLIRDDRNHTELYKTAIHRLRGLLEEEENDKPEDELAAQVTAAKDIFQLPIDLP